MGMYRAAHLYCLRVRLQATNKSQIFEKTHTHPLSLCRPKTYQRLYVFAQVKNMFG